MPWTCPNGCHEEPTFSVIQNEHRTDMMAHVYGADDKELAHELSDPKVYVGDDGEYDEPECSLCESQVHWKDADGTMTITWTISEEVVLPPPHPDPVVRERQRTAVKKLLEALRDE